MGFHGIHGGVARLRPSLNYGGMLLISVFLIYNVLNLGIFTVPLGNEFAQKGGVSLYAAHETAHRPVAGV